MSMLIPLFCSRIKKFQRPAGGPARPNFAPKPHMAIFCLHELHMASSSLLPEMGSIIPSFYLNIIIFSLLLPKISANPARLPLKRSFFIEKRAFLLYICIYFLTFLQQYIFDFYKKICYNFKKKHFFRTAHLAILLYNTKKTFSSLL